MKSKSELPSDVIDAIHANRNIEAIKRLREQRGLGLKEAKHAVEAYARQNPQPITAQAPQSESGVGRLIIIGIIVAVVYAVYWYFN
jgi:hypothetical protein